MKFIDTTNEHIKKVAEKFITQIKNHSIKKRTLHNSYEKYPMEESFESFKSLSSSPKTEKLMTGAYNDRKKSGKKL